MASLLESVFYLCMVIFSTLKVFNITVVFGRE